MISLSELNELEERVLDTKYDGVKLRDLIVIEEHTLTDRQREAVLHVS